MGFIESFTALWIILLVVCIVFAAASALVGILITGFGALWGGGNDMGRFGDMFLIFALGAVVFFILAMIGAIGGQV